MTFVYVERFYDQSSNLAETRFVDSIVGRGDLAASQDMHLPQTVLSKLNRCIYVRIEADAED